MATRMQQRRGTAAQWISTNSGNGPILNAGEIGFETDTNKFKIGDGTNHWINLDYFIDANSTVNPAFGSSITFEGATANAFETTIQVTDPTADRTITFPDATGTVALTSDISELSQDAIDSALTAGTGITKTYNDAANTLTIAVDTTSIQARVADVSDTEIGYLNGVTSAIQTQLDDKAPSSTAVTLTGTQTLTNKTLTSPSITIPAATTTLYGPSTSPVVWAGDDPSGGEGGTRLKTAVNEGLGAMGWPTDPSYYVGKTIVISGVTGSTAMRLWNGSHLITDTSVAFGEIFFSGSTIAYKSNGQLQGDVLFTVQQVTAEKTISATEVGYVDGVTSAIQTQLDAKAPSSTAVTLTGTQTLTNKTLTSPVITGAVFNDGSIVFEGATADAFETTLAVTDPTADRTITFPDATGTVALAANVAALSGATFTGAVSGTDLTLSGNLTVNGTTTNINSTNLVVEDKNIVLADVTSPTDTTADGGGITLKGATDKTFNWVDATDAWTSSEDMNLLIGKVYEIAGTPVLSGTTLGSGVTGSSLTSVGTIATGTWNATTIALNKGGTGATTQAGAANAILPTQASNSGKFLTTNGTDVSWATLSSYSAPTLGSTSIASGATVTTIAGLTLTAPTLTGTVTASGDINLSAAGGPGSVIDELTLMLMGAI